MDRNQYRAHHGNSNGRGMNYYQPPPNSTNPLLGDEDDYYDDDDNGIGSNGNGGPIDYYYNDDTTNNNNDQLYDNHRQQARVGGGTYYDDDDEEVYTPQYLPSSSQPASGVVRTSSPRGGGEGGSMNPTTTNTTVPSRTMSPTAANSTTPVPPMTTGSRMMMPGSSMSIGPDGNNSIAGASGMTEDLLYLHQLCAEAFPPNLPSKDAPATTTTTTTTTTKKDGKTTTHIILDSENNEETLQKQEVAAALAAADASWDPVRQWMQTHSVDQVRAAALYRDDAGKTALHIACQNVPPMDVLGVFLSCASDVISWPDSFGWLPIHYACAYGATATCIQSLAEAYVESKTTVDRKGRTPLHFFVGTTSNHKPDSPAVVVLLSSTGAAAYPDDNGMLPLHYACAYGASEESLYVLTDAYPDGISTMDRKGRTPLHFALSNAGRKAAPAAVRLLLTLNKNLVNASSAGGGKLPLRVLAEYATATIKKNDIEPQESCQACLKHLLHAKPKPTADFFTALQSLPYFLEERAVVMKSVQELLNEKICQRFPTLILMLDFYVQILVVAFYSVTIKDSIDVRFTYPDQTYTWKQAAKEGLLSNDDNNNNNDNDIFDGSMKKEHFLLPLWLGASYFLAREVIQILSLISLKALHIWANEPSNWLNVIYIFLIYVWTYLMETGKGDKYVFRTGTAISIIILWTKFLAYLRNVLIDFAVFTGGVFHVIRRLMAFLLCLMIILVAFSRMFYTLFLGSPNCNGPSPYMNYTTNPPHMNYTLEIWDLQCDDLNVTAWCDEWNSFLAIYTMLLGQVDETMFQLDPDNKTVAVVLYCVFFFMVVILLANVLIAIVTDSYKVIQDQRAAIVFWTNRLDFIAQMDAIANGPWKKVIHQALCFPNDTTSYVDHDGGSGSSFGKDFWKRLMDLLFEDDTLDDGMFSIEFICYTGLRIVTLVFIIPLWILLGICTAGWLWPPQIREYVFTSTVNKHNSESEKEDELRKTQIHKLKVEIGVLKEDLAQELAMDRTLVVQMKSMLAERKLEIQNEMKHIKRIVAMLFEQQASM